MTKEGFISKQTLPIAKWEFWGSESFISSYPLSGYQTLEPDVSFLPLLQRRRLNFLSKIFFHVVNKCEPTAREMPIVYGSRYGELPRTINILKSLGQEELISPTDFSHSVHNTPVALYSIFTKNHQPMNAIAAGEDSLMATIIETAALFHTEKKDALLVFVEDKMPEPYTQPNPEEAIHSYGIALLVSADNPQFTLSWQKKGTQQNPKLQIASFASGLYEKASSFKMNAFGSEYIFNKDMHG